MLKRFWNYLKDFVCAISSIDMLIAIGVALLACGAGDLNVRPIRAQIDIAGGALILAYRFRGISFLKIHQTVAQLTTDQAKALYEATSAIYFADNSDYESALWYVVRALSPETAVLLEKDSEAAYNQSFKAYHGIEPD